MKRFLIVLFSFCLFGYTAAADEGMWLPSLIGTQIKDMKSKGFKLSAEDIYSVNKASLKDAVVLFDGGCSGELVSGEGLLLTNHHCGYDQIQRHSSLEHDYLTNGFWAMDRSEELPNPGLKVSFLVRMDDVTDRVLDGVSDGMAPEERKAKIDANIDALKKEILSGVDGKGYMVSVESMYYGNQYFSFLYREYSDVRLVAAPPSSIGKFGGDTDNWIWPRHTGDFSVFRIYADENNDPADYSPDNVPYRPHRHFTVSTKGVREGDCTFVYGFPGSTREYVTSDYVDYVLNYSNPVKIRLRTERLDIINEAMESDPELRIMYSSKAAYIANAWKKWQGESLGLARLGTLDKKLAYETAFSEWAADKSEYAGVLSALSETYADRLPYAAASDLFIESVNAVELFGMAYDVAAAVTNGSDLTSVYKDYSPEVDRQIAYVMFDEYMTNMPSEFIPTEVSAMTDSLGSIRAYVDWIFDNSVFASADRATRLAGTTAAELTETLKKDPATSQWNALAAMFNEVIYPVVSRTDAELAALYPVYMRGQMEFEPDRNFYPDANLTLRVSYGTVEGYREADAFWLLPNTTLEGVMEKDNPEIYDYDVPQRLREIYETKDYGRWGINIGTRKEPFYTVPVAFIATNHTTGGNSGSPVLNGRGELVGINFDRTWLSTMSDLEFDPQICRNIIVDIRYVLFVIDKIGGAGYLLDEMTLK